MRDPGPPASFQGLKLPPPLSRGREIIFQTLRIVTSGVQSTSEGAGLFKVFYRCTEREKERKIGFSGAGIWNRRNGGRPD